MIEADVNDDCDADASFADAEDYRTRFIAAVEAGLADCAASRTIPDDELGIRLQACSCDDDRACVITAIERGIAASDAGLVYTTDEVRQHMDALFTSLGVD